MDAGRHLHVQLSAEARAGWDRFAAEHGVTVASLVEAVGLVLGNGLSARAAGEVVAIARQVTSERRVRRRR